MSAEDNKAVVRRLIEEVYNEGNMNVVDELVAPDFFDHAAVPEHQHGIDGFKHVMQWVRTVSSDVHYDIDDIISEGEKVGVRMTQSGTHTGTVRGIPPLASVSRSTMSTGSVWRTGRSRSYGP
jgi:predicted ester cyclase